MLHRMRLPSMRTVLCMLVAAVLIGARQSGAVKWLAMYRHNHRPWTSLKNCSRSSGLVSGQVRLCKAHLDLMSTVAHSAMVGIETCASQFRHRRWNCSSVKGVPELGKDLIRGTREQAYVYGISSAALVHTVSRACSIGVSTKCNCGTLPHWEPEEDFKWGGCGDDLKYGLYFGEVFTNATLIKKGGRLKRSKKAMMNRHNFRVGREVVRSSLSRQCKCHGVSGSCAQKTCWRALASFESIGAVLKERYGHAVEVRRKRLKKSQRKILVPTRRGRKHFRRDELVYYERSPDYCSPDYKTGSVGTRGRECNPRSRGPDSCDAMCCGRGYDTFTQTLRERCECKYVWCCYVKCNTCTRVVNVGVCR